MKKSKSVQEKRKSVRFHIQSIVKLAVESGGVIFSITNIRNISRGGLAFYTDQKIKEGALLRLYFLPPNCEKPVEAKGKIVRCSRAPRNKKAFKIGIQFLDISEEAKLAIQELEAFFLADQEKE